ncbi:fasciclin domain protein [Nostoc sp. NIES-3756]|uniref:COP23 domain-containing protein n=1 Tax=Nostoc sp. NIES-3756 TaxID=1751286 RepID=UPI00071EAC81|nr:COP23 domain-containing protein [Nostoc sp. NIES-3756]BAT51537.1 fasciclin domain protein [Nostoc sp. NIES-3756]BAY40742.1 fasciclin domain protein [Nostoc sp. NIES-2111]
MNLDISSQVLTWGVRVVGVGALTMFISTTLLNQPSVARNPVFRCDAGRFKGKSVPTTFVFTQDGKKVPLIYWVSDHFAGLKPQQRCQQVSYRFQRSYDNGTLRYIKTGILNRQPVVCATAERNAGCTNNNLLFTLKPGSDPDATARQLFDRRALASRNATNQSGGETSNDPVNIDIEAFLYFAPSQPSAGESNNP